MTSPFTRDELISRIHSLQEKLVELKLDGALIMQRVDMIYYSGVAFPGAVAIPATGDPRIYAWRRLHMFDESTPVEPIQVKGMGHMLAVLKGDAPGQWKRIGLEDDVLPVATYKSLANKVWPHSELLDISPAIRNQRSVKSATELDIIRASGKVLSGGFNALLDIIKPGITEYEVHSQMDVMLRRHGDQASGRTRSFNSEAGGVIAFGVSASVDNAFDGPIGQPGRNSLVPKGSSDRIIEPNEPIICDHTAGVDGYITDMTRTFCVCPDCKRVKSGSSIVRPSDKLDPRFLDAHQFCVELHHQLIEKTRAGAIPSELFRMAFAEAEHAGFGENFMNMGRNKVRFIGHGVGMEMDEWPVLAKGFDQPLEAGTVLAIEPKIIYPDGGVGVEDTVIVHDGMPAEVVTEMGLELQRVGQAKANVARFR